MSARKKLPARRELEAIAVVRHRVDGNTERLTLTVGRHADGRIGEVFLDMGKPASDSAYLARDAGLILSIALQYGVPIDELRDAVGRGNDGVPHTVIGTALDVLAGESAAAIDQSFVHQSGGASQETEANSPRFEGDDATSDRSAVDGSETGSGSPSEQTDGGR